VLRRVRLILPAQLEGMGRHEDCRVHATKVSLPGSDTYEYVRPIIFGEPADLPDGIYALTFDGRSIPSQHLNEGWIIRGTHFSAAQHSV
jgi:hypothetical protein